MADAQGDAADHWCGVCICGCDGDVFMDDGHSDSANLNLNDGLGTVVRSKMGAVMGKKWYVVHAYSGFEKSVARALQDRIQRAEMQEKFGQILVPVEEVVEMKSGQKNISERKFFPGYVLVEMEMTDETWHLVKNTNKVTGFVGGSAMKPTPISQKDVDKILQQVQEGVEKP